MRQPISGASVPDLNPVLEALSHLGTADSLLHLETALGALSTLADILHRGPRLCPEEQQETEQALRAFRQQLRQANLLTDQGLRLSVDPALIPITGGQAYGQSGRAVSSSREEPDLRIEG